MGDLLFVKFYIKCKYIIFVFKSNVGKVEYFYVWNYGFVSIILSDVGYKSKNNWEEKG